MTEERKYYARMDIARAGWCVFKKNSELISEYQAGAFKDEATANKARDILNKSMEAI